MCVRIWMPQTKSLSNKSEVYTVMLDGVCVRVCVCVHECVSCMWPRALCSCEDTLNDHSAHVSHMSGAHLALSR